MKPGTYPNIPHRIYHGPTWNRTDEGNPVFSNSMLRASFRSPAHWWESVITEQSSTTTAMDIGTVAHIRLLSPPDFNDQVSVSPFDSFRTNEAKAWRDEKQQHGITIITESDLARVDAMVAVAKDDTDAYQFLLHSDYNELSVYTELEGLPFKCRLDAAKFDEERIADYKTTSDASPFKFSRHAINMRYHVQAGLYVHALESVTSAHIEQFALVAQETEPPYVVQTYLLGRAEIDAGYALARAKLLELKQCIADGVFPAYANEPIPITLPQWEWDAIDRLSGSGSPDWAIMA